MDIPSVKTGQQMYTVSEVTSRSVCRLLYGLPSRPCLELHDDSRLATGPYVCPGTKNQDVVIVVSWSPGYRLEEGGWAAGRPAYLACCSPEGPRAAEQAD